MTPKEELKSSGYSSESQVFAIGSSETVGSHHKNAASIVDGIPLYTVEKEMKKFGKMKIALLQQKTQPMKSPAIVNVQEKAHTQTEKPSEPIIEDSQPESSSENKEKSPFVLTKEEEVSLQLKAQKEKKARELQIEKEQLMAQHEEDEIVNVFYSQAPKGSQYLLLVNAKTNANSLLFFDNMKGSFLLEFKEPFTPITAAVTAIASVTKS